MIRILFTLTIWVLAAFPVQAGPDRLSFSVGSLHVNPTSDFNEFNPGVFLTWDRTARKYHLGAYYNSYSRISVGAFAAYPIAGNENFTVDILYGAAYYPEDGRNFPYSWGDIVPILGLQTRIGYFFGQVFPGDGDVVDAIISVGLTFPTEMLFPGR
jgi:hypothetical protein